MQMIAKGTRVSQVLPEIEGVVDDAKLDTDTGKINYHVTYTDANGEPSARWFGEDELEVLDDGKVSESQTISKADVGDATKLLGSKAK